MRHLAAVLLLLAIPLVGNAQWIEGTHYEVLTVTPAERDDDRIEVIEAFWYGCPSCYNFEPHLIRWLARKPDDVNFVRVAASMSPSWRVHSRAYYTAEALGVLDPMHQRVFNAIHQERNRLDSPEALAALFHEHASVEPETFLHHFRSYAVETSMRSGDELVRRYRVGAVPTIVVNGKYRTNPGMTRGYPQLIALLDHLIELERNTE